MESFAFQYDGGLKLAGNVIAFDRPGNGLSFISSADVPGAWKSSKALCTDTAAALLSVVRREFRPLVLPVNRTMELGALKVRLIDAGPMPGAAALLVEHSGRRMLYCAGVPDFRGYVLKCDVLAATVSSIDVEPEAAGLSRLTGSVRSAMQAGLVPTVRCGSIGVARSACAALTAAGIPLKLHRYLFRFARCWRSLGIDAGSGSQFRGAQPRGDDGFAVVLPAHLGPDSVESGLLHTWKICLVRAGSRTDPGGSGSVARCGSPVDETIVLPGCPGPANLIEMLKNIGPSEVVLTGEGADVCGRIAVGSGYSVTVFDPFVQCSLPL